MKKNPHAQALGRLTKGIKKTLTPEQREEKAKLLGEARKKRWPVKEVEFTNIRRSKAEKSSPG